MAMNDKQTLHEDLAREQTVAQSSDRAFGYVFAAVFLIIGVWPMVGGDGVRLWSLGISLVFLGLAVASPKLLAPFNRLWMKFGRLLHQVISPIILGILFFTVITPYGLVMRLFGKKILELDFKADTESYWIKRDPPGPPPESMRNQF